MCRKSSRGPRMFTISTEAGTVTRRNSSRPPSSALEPDAFLDEFKADDSRGRALGASGALAVNSELLSWLLADDRECQHLILGQEPATPPTLTSLRAEARPTARCASMSNLDGRGHIGLKRKPIGRGNECFEDPGLCERVTCHRHDSEFGPGPGLMQLIRRYRGGRNVITTLNDDP